ncbi:MAG: hypothetical protein AABX70_05660 [Nanoarchaeota archaeon]
MKRGQSALEFLMTYGWAILIILVMIAALVYFGVFNPSRLTPERCTAVPGFGCNDYQMNSDGSANFLIANAKGDSITLTSTTAFSMNSTSGGCLNTAVASTTWASDEVKTVAFPAACPAITAAVGDKQKVTVYFTYTPKGGSFAKKGSVDVNALVS